MVSQIKPSKELDWLKQSVCVAIARRNRIWGGIHTIDLILATIVLCLVVLS